MCPLSQSVVVKIRRGGEWRQENVARINVVCTADTILYKQTIHAISVLLSQLSLGLMSKFVPDCSIREVLASRGPNQWRDRY